MLTLVNIYRQDFRRSDGTFAYWYDLLCSDTYESPKSRLCGSPTKTVRVNEYVLNKALGGDDQSNMIQPVVAERMIGKSVYVMYNDRGYVSYLRFYDPDDKKQASSSEATSASDSSYPEFDEVVT